MKKLALKIMSFICLIFGITALASCQDTTGSVTSTEKPVTSTTENQGSTSSSTEKPVTSTTIPDITISTTDVELTDDQIKAMFSLYLTQIDLSKDNVNKTIRNLVNSEDINFSFSDLSIPTMKMLAHAEFDENADLTDYSDYHAYLWQENKNVYFAQDSDDYDCGYGITKFDLEKLDALVASKLPEISSDTDYVSYFFTLMNMDEEAIKEEEILMANFKPTINDFKYSNKVFTYDTDSFISTLARAMTNVETKYTEEEIKTTIKERLKQHVTSLELTIGFDGKSFTKFGFNIVIPNNDTDDDGNEVKGEVDFNIQANLAFTETGYTVTDAKVSLVSTLDQLSLKFDIKNDNNKSITIDSTIIFNFETSYEETDELNLTKVVNVNSTVTITGKTTIDIANEKITSNGTIKVTSNETVNQTLRASIESTYSYQFELNDSKITFTVNNGKTDVVALNVTIVNGSFDNLTLSIDGSIIEIFAPEYQEVKSITITVTTKDVEVPDYNRDWAYDFIEENFGE